MRHLQPNKVGVVLLLVSGALADDIPSLFLDSKAQHALAQVKKMTDGDELESFDAVPASERPLGGILYVDADHWTIWLQGRKITSAAPDEVPGLKIVRVTPTQVEVIQNGVAKIL